MTEEQTCIWTRNSEDSRWDTECDELLVLWEDENPWRYGFNFCPFCGRRCVEGIGF